MHLKAFDPPTLDTAGAVWIMGARYALVQAIWHFRCIKTFKLARLRKEYRDLAVHHLGRASAYTSVLYDIGHPSAYHISKRVELLREIIGC